MAMTLEKMLIRVWRQALVEEAKTVTVENQNVPVRRTTRSGLRQVNFQFGGVLYVGLEQNTETGSRWAQLARQGKKVMQFLRGGRYVAVVVDGKAQFYGERTLSSKLRR